MSLVLVSVLVLVLVLVSVLGKYSRTEVSTSAIDWQCSEDEFGRKSKENERRWELGAIMNSIVHFADTHSGSHGQP